METKLGSTVVSRLNSVRMSEVDRQNAIHTLHDAELVVDAFVWVAKKIEQIGERLFLKPALRH